ncbi:triosephosphate isomerase, putative [Plasmodium gaboni]|uniref:Triosephosphate isomerase n=1 Tax=Plasmodium gaboni TaxID=647221 RepID=A0ABY1UHJ8_9APIC|nr:triosephosphate isomerase, putative [Plasmodium gaboni]
MLKTIVLLSFYSLYTVFQKSTNCLTKYSSFRKKGKECYILISSNYILKNKSKKFSRDTCNILKKFERNNSSDKNFIKTYSVENENDYMENIFTHDEQKKIKKKKKILIANWKCYLSKEEAYKLIDTLTRIKYSNYIDVILSLNLLYIPYLLRKIQENNSKIYACSQDVSLVNDFGPYTGETTAKLIYEFGIKYTLIGHSERRQGFYKNGETIEQIALKVYNAINSKLKVILCIGDDYKNSDNSTSSYKMKELLRLIKTKISKDDMKNIIIAFEPRFAIGTGKPVPYDVLNKYYYELKRDIAKEIDKSTSEEMMIVYGGSITKSNMKIYVDNTNVDGFLIGKASLNEDFIDIIRYVDH